MPRDDAHYQMGRHYDERSPVVEALHDGHVHMGYWYGSDDDASLTTAVRGLEDKVVATLGLRPGEHVLDAGCGPGATAVALARAHQVRVTGVTVSEFEAGRAVDRARAGGVADLVDVARADYSQLPYPDGHFDAVLSLESLQHAPDLDQVLRELRRVLRPGGRLAFSDFTLESAAEQERIDAFMTTLHIVRLPSLAEWVARVRQAGFVVEEYTQCGLRVFGQKGRYIRAAAETRDTAVAQVGESAVAISGRRHRGFFAPRVDQVGYAVVCARRPYE